MLRRFDTMPFPFFAGLAILAGFLLLLWAMTPVFNPKTTFATFRFSLHPSLVPVRKDDSRDRVEYVSFKTLLETRCPSLFLGYRPLWWIAKYMNYLFWYTTSKLIIWVSGHLQTLYNAIKQFCKEDQVWYKRYVKWFHLNFSDIALTLDIRTYLRLADGGTLWAIFWYRLFDWSQILHLVV